MKPCKIYGHQRSGNHYLAALLNKNFYNYDSYIKLFGRRQHGMLPEAKLNPEIKYIYIYRRGKDVMDSMFRFRERLQLDAESFPLFATTPYNQMFRPDIKSKIKVRYDNKEWIDDSGCTFFANNTCTPVEWHIKHLTYWFALEVKYNNIIKISYCDIKDKFVSIMQKISTFLESDKKEFENIKEKVGYICTPE